MFDARLAVSLGSLDSCVERRGGKRRGWGKRFERNLGVAEH